MATVDVQETQRLVPDVVPESAQIAPRPTVRETPRQAVPVNEPATGLSYRHSQTFGRLMMALAAAQGEFSAIEKTLTAIVQSKREGARSYTYQYADLRMVLEAVRPALSKHGLAVMQLPSVRRDGLAVTTMLAHGESGEWFAGDLAVALDSRDPQAVGTATSYARRYGLTAMLGVAAGEPDDDGAQASKPRKEPPSAPAGYDIWFTDLRSVADEGTTRLQAVWAESRPDFRTYLTSTAAQKWTEIKAIAERVSKGAKA